MKRIFVDFNTVMQDEAQGNQVSLGRYEEVASGDLPVLCVGEHVIAYDDEMEVEAALDWTTLKRFAPLG